MAADRVGQQLGNYRLIRLLGQGGFAEVYLGEHIHLGTQAAIKLLRTQLVSEDASTFRNEARTLARLVHPHIVRVFDFGIEGEMPFLVMDYASNGTVRNQYPKGVVLPLLTILNYVKQVADALQYAHDEHLIHRDIKPENLLVGRRQEILLSDFGIALFAQTSRSQSIQDVAGTANYMAPEQFQGKPRPASDQYALAIMVYEWLTGTCPFHGSFTEIASQHLFMPPPPLQGKVPGISPAIEQVVLTALAKDPHHRFSSVQVFAVALEQACSANALSLFPTSQSLHPTNVVSLPGTVQPPIVPATSPSESVIPTKPSSTASQTSTFPMRLSLSPQPLAGISSVASSQRGIPRRTVVIGLTGVAIVSLASVGLIWSAHSLSPQVSSPSASPTVSPNNRSTANTTINIFDRASILDANRVRNEASSLQIRLDVYTISNFNGSTTAFNQNVISSIANSNAIVLSICTNLHYVSIVGGRNVGLSNSQYTDATNSFINDYRSNHDYTSATIAAIDSLRRALGS
jgi:serine/threonine protein kinase